MEENKSLADIPTVYTLPPSKCPEEPTRFCNEVKQFLRTVYKNSAKGERKRELGQLDDEDKSDKSLYERCRNECNEFTIINGDSIDPFQYYSLFPAIEGLNIQPINSSCLNPFSNVQAISTVRNEESEPAVSSQLPVFDGEESKHAKETPELHQKYKVKGKMKNLVSDVSQIREAASYKLVMKCIGKFIINNHNEVERVLKKSGWKKKDIENCIEKLPKRIDKKKSLNFKTQKAMLDKLVTKRSPQTYIVRRALKVELDVIDSENDVEKAAKKKRYRELCQRYYEKSLYTIRNAQTDV